MATARQCRAALESLTGRITDLDDTLRRIYLTGRTVSCHVDDLRITFVTQLGPGKAQSVRQANCDLPPAQIRFTARSDDVIAIARDPRCVTPAWQAGRLKIEGSFLDLLILKNLL